MQHQNTYILLNHHVHYIDIVRKSSRADVRLRPSDIHSHLYVDKKHDLHKCTVIMVPENSIVK